MVEALGPGCAYLVTDVTEGEAGNNKRLAFVFDTSRVHPSGLACELVVADHEDGTITRRTSSAHALTSAPPRGPADRRRELLRGQGFVPARMLAYAPCFPSRTAF